MSTSHNLHRDAQASSHAPTFLRLRVLGRKLLALPGLRILRPVARRAMAVAEPPDQLSLQSLPSTPFTRRCNTLKILSANLWHDWPLHRHQRQRLESFARLVEAEQADIVLLQEVARTAELRVDEWLTQRLGMAYVYTRANGHEAAIGFEEGLAVFSRLPLTAPRRRQLESGSNPFVHRLALGSRIETACGGLWVFSVHLGIPRRQNSLQLARLHNWVAHVAGNDSAVIGGDFNAAEHTSQISRAQRKWTDTFRHLHPTADGATHELHWPWGNPLHRSRLDYIFLRPGEPRWIILEARHVDAPGGGHSDHRAVIVRLTCPA